MASKIEITFLDGIAIDDYLSFRIFKFVTPTFGQTQQETFKALRSTNGQVTLDTNGIKNATNFVTSFNIDYNGFALYFITRISNVVTIEFTSDEWNFDTWQTNSAFISSNLVPIVPTTFSFVEKILQNASADFCNKVGSSIETDELATIITLNGVVLTTTNINNPYLYDIDRGIVNTFILENATGDLLNYVIPSIDYLTSDNISINIIQSLSGATLTVTVINAIGLTLEYSLDNVNWQTSNIFTGQEEGTRFLYVRDNYGCIKSKGYTVTALGTRTAFHKISKANSINFSLSEIWNGCSIFKNDENTLQCQELVKYNYINKILFQTCDYTTTQIKSNFETVTATLRDSLLNETPLTISKKTSNLNRFKSLDAKYYKYRTGKLGIYFDTGNLYDEFGIDIGDYTLNGNLPEFAILGVEIELKGIGVYKIVDILYDEDKNKRVIIIDYTFNGLDTSVIISSIYDVIDYDVYEFDIDWSLYSIGSYDIVVKHIDTINGERTYISENINLAVEHKDTLAIRYFNNNNRDIFYKYGIEHFIRIPFIYFIAKQKDEQEINITDLSASVVESTVYELNEIKFDTVATEIMRKLVVSLSCENVFINGVGYVKDGNIETENIQNTNLYEVTATMLKTNVSYTNFKQGQTGIDNDSGTFDIPLIITAGTNFIKS